MIKSIIHFFKKSIKYEIYKKKWRKSNKHNFTTIRNIFTDEIVCVGKYSYGALYVKSYGNPDEKLTIGNFCSIALGVKFILGGEHHPEFLMNYPFKQYLQESDDIDDRRTKGSITVEDDVWIGTDALILSGVTIGQGAIIGAGSIVTKDVPPYAIYTTNKIIRYRFPQNIIELLLKIDFSKMDITFAKEHLNLFYSEDVESILKDSRLNKFMKEY